MDCTVGVRGRTVADLSLQVETAVTRTSVDASERSDDRSVLQALGSNYNAADVASVLRCRCNMTLYEPDCRQHHLQHPYIVTGETHEGRRVAELLGAK